MRARIDEQDTIYTVIRQTITSSNLLKYMLKYHLLKGKYNIGYVSKNCLFSMSILI